MNRIPDDFRRRAFKLCAKYLGGTWTRVGMDKFHVEVVSGGLSNFLYRCFLSPDVNMNSGETSQVLIRIYGEILHKDPDMQLINSLVFSMLADRKLGPQLFGVFHGGRLEQYLPSRCLTTSELHLEETSTTVARIMGRFHNLTMPLSKDSSWLFRTMSSYLDDINGIQFKEFHRQKLFDELCSIDLHQEYNELKELLISVNSPIVLCHNDLQEGNILLLNDDDARHYGDSLLAIDFEYCSYNYRAFDIANHFCEWCYNYTNPDPPYFWPNDDDFPSIQQQTLFLEVYLKSYECNRNCILDGISSLLPSPPNSSSSSPSSPSSPSLPSDCSMKLQNGSHSATMKSIQREVSYFVLASHYFWFLWSLVQAKLSVIPFDYLEYAKARFSAYSKHKQSILLDTTTQCAIDSN